MKYLIEEYKNEILVKEFEIEADNDLDLCLKLAPNTSLRYGNQIIKSLKIKNSDIEVSISSDGVFFYFSPSGEEIVLDNLNYQWLCEPVGAYHSHILKELDVETLIFKSFK